MSEVNDGGPAFPQSEAWGSSVPVPTGMTLRDWFAGQALAGFFASPLFKGDLNSASDDAFRVADAMIERGREVSEAIEAKNAVIESATITRENGLLDCWLTLDYGGEGQGFGGYALYLPKGYTNHKLDSVAGHFLYRVMEVAGVTRWDNLKGKTVRVHATESKVHAIGHIVKDDWFSPSEDFKRLLSEAA